MYDKKVFPIDPELVKMHSRLPVLLAELSHKNEEAALELLRAWGEHTKPIRQLYKEINKYLNEEK
ncbi:hypothetical protein I6G82_02915 [Lysinibacillus macroides]|uniref:Uncharacterized protein n=1 Tax=Lysinibacillus macroides TaxID=33935 RepID=A0A0M9DIQ7_9BACI|nr:hypothetical protein [Lysinibacillus macroides]KOY81246.1 hypothetical protein ADM90_19070 [Lysinibacillus macroides]QPR68600.1 hypothetical protein I6G82_02915 [Lysinibacillus macroides]